MVTFKRFLQHHLNPLHIYCRLRDAGVRPHLTSRMCVIYERWVYRFLAL
ncbi:MAG: hypothetical protein KKE73_15580 [Proteobacteria bacterium]|nr:hypothetical protein [Pseudomonadota bacterium]